jgi:NADP-dependent 3-hydroxy acid dehydrogenase YdfG
LKKTPNVLISDINKKELKKTANELCCSFQLCDVSKETNIKNLIEVAQKRFGHIDLFCSNAGITSNLKRFYSIEQNACWEKTWNVNLMSHVYAARYALPNMIKRKRVTFYKLFLQLLFFRK